MREQKENNWKNLNVCWHKMKENDNYITLKSSDRALMIIKPKGFHYNVNSKKETNIKEVLFIKIQAM